MNESAIQKSLTVFFRIAVGWTFLYAGARQVLDPGFSVVAFLAHTKTFHDFFAVFATPEVAPYTSFLVKWGHLLIGISLVSGLLVRVSGVFAIFLLGTYYFAHMDFPYIESKINMIIDYHLVYMGTVLHLISKRAGHLWGLDAIASKLSFVERHPALSPLVN